MLAEEFRELNWTGSLADYVDVALERGAVAADHPVASRAGCLARALREAAKK